MTYQECKRKTYQDNVLPDRKIFVKSRDINFMVVTISKKTAPPQMQSCPIYIYINQIVNKIY